MGRCCISVRFLAPGLLSLKLAAEGGEVRGCRYLVVLSQLQGVHDGVDLPLALVGRSLEVLEEQAEHEVSDQRRAHR